jgi:hypothetical protein
MDEAVRRQASARLAYHAEKLRLEQAAWADYQYRKRHPWRARLRALAALLDNPLQRGNDMDDLSHLEGTMHADPSLTVQQALMAVPIAVHETAYGCCAWGLVETGGCNCGSPADASVGYAHEPLCGWEQCPNGCWERLHPAV